jgi:tetratricopeptide (TPR) repeat protein
MATRKFWNGIRNPFKDTSQTTDAMHLRTRMQKSIALWVKTREAADLDAAISFAEQAVEAVPEGNSARVAYLKDLWTGLNTRFQIRQQIADLNKAIVCMEEALISLQPTDIQRRDCLMELGTGYFARYQRNQNLADLDNAIEHGEKVLATTLQEDAAYLLQLSSLVVRLKERHHRLGELGDLDKALTYAHSILHATPDAAPSLLDHIMVCYVGRYQYTGNEDDLNEAVLMGQKIEQNMRENDPCVPDYLTNIGNVHHVLFLRTDDLHHLTQAIDYAEQALKLSNKDNKNYSLHVGSLGGIYFDLFERSGRLEDLEKAIDYDKKAVESNINGLKGLIPYLNLGVALHRLFEVTGQEKYLDEAFSCVELAESSPTNNYSYSAMSLYYLGIMFLRRFNQRGLAADIKMAEHYTTQSLNALPDAHHDRMGCLATLGSIHRSRFHSTGDMSELDEAITYGVKAIDMIKTGHYTLSIANSSMNLAVSLIDRYYQTSHVTDLEQVIRYSKAAVDASPKNSPARGEYLACLSAGLRNRFSRTQKIDNLDCAIEHGEEAIHVLLQHHVHRPMCLHVLALNYQTRFQISRNASDFDRAVQCLEEALTNTPEDHFECVRYLNSLGSIYKTRYGETRRLGDLDESIKYARQAVDFSPKDHPDRVKYLINLGNHLFLRSGPHSVHKNQDFWDATKSYQDAISIDQGLPIERFTAGYCAVRNLAMVDDMTSASEVLGQALALVRMIVSPTNSRSDMQYLLPKLRGLGLLAASILCRLGKPALDSLHAREQCTNIIASHTINGRPDTAILRTNYPDLWSRYSELQASISGISLKSSSFYSGQTAHRNFTDTVSRLQQLYGDLNKTRDEIRTKIGLEMFLLSPTEKDIRDMAKYGSIVYLNISPISSEAFLITTKGTRVLNLPDLDEDNAVILSRQFSRGRKSFWRDASWEDEDEDENEDLYFNVSENLEDLWRAAVKPILRELGVLEEGSNLKDATKLARIWWVGGGKFGLPPLHAAGDHSPGSIDNTISHVISSYSPSLNALQFIQQPPVSIDKDHQDILLVSMPTTPGYDDLNADIEVNAIEKHASSWTSVTKLEYPSKLEVLSALKSCTIAHFACHGSADATNPAENALLLGRKGTENGRYEVDRLTVEDLDNASSNCAQVVYLSACSTAENKVQDLRDENIHLASAFQLYGFRHVICTLCSVDDNASVEIAKAFYESLKSGDATDGNRIIATALHNAVLRYRNTGENWESILNWAPFIHLGC